MSAILQKIEDPRDALDKARQFELYKFAQAHGVTEITKTMPAIIMRQKLRARGLTNINIPPRPLGTPDFANKPVTSQDVNSVNAEADLARQYSEQKMEKSIDEMSRAELAHTCKVRGIKMSRKDTKDILAEKLRGKNAA